MMVAQKGARRRSRVTGARGWTLLFLAPVTIGIAVVYYAALQGIALGFTDWDVISAPSLIGLQNFQTLISDPRFWTAFRNTAGIVLITVPLKLVIGLVFALALNRVVKFGNFFRLALFFPFTCSVVAVSFIWKYFYDADGALNRIRETFGMPSITWMDPSIALWSVSAMIVWSGVGYIALLFLSGLQSIPAQYYEAAIIDGAGAFARFRYITLPLLTPTTFFLVVISLIAAFQTFGEVYILVGPIDSTLTLMSYIYERAFAGFQMGYASAISAVLIGLILIVTLIQLWVQRRWVSYDN